MVCSRRCWIALVVVVSWGLILGTGCGGGGRKAPPPPPPAKAQVMHPFGSGLGHLLTDVAYEIDTGSSWPVEFVRTLIENAPAKAADLNAPFVHPDNEELRFQDFHVWPNLFHLTAIHDADPQLYVLLMDQVMAREPQASVRTQVDARVTAGDRVFLARDFVDEVRVGNETLFEVHFVLLINLDARTVTEVHAHRFPLARLPRLHDARVDDLAALFASPPAAPGMAWDLCLRGNIQRIHREAIVVDYLQDLRFHLARLASCGGEARNPVLTRGLLPWIPREPPKEPVPPTPNKNPPPTIIPDPDPPLHPGGVFTPPFVRPWPFPGPQPPEPPADPTGGAGGTPPSPTSGCAPEGPAILALKYALEMQWATGRAEWDADRALLQDFRWSWPAGAAFFDPDLQAAYDACDPEIQDLTSQIDQIEDQIEVVEDAWEALEEAKPVVVSTIPWTDSLWDQVLTLGGFWSRVRVSCLVTVVFPDNTVIPVTAHEQTEFQRWIAGALSNGATWAQAVEVALANDAAARTRQGFTAGENLIFRQAWIQYAACLRELQRQALLLFIPALEGMEGATADEVARIIAYMFDRDPSILTAAEVQAKSDCEQAAALRRAEIENLRASQAQLAAEREDKRLDFLGQMRDGPMKARLDELNRQRQRIWILCAYPVWCDDAGAPEAFPLAGPWLCDELLALQSDPQFSGFPAFQQYVQMLLAANC